MWVLYHKKEEEEKEKNSYIIKPSPEPAYIYANNKEPSLLLGVISIYTHVLRLSNLSGCEVIIQNNPDISIFQKVGEKNLIYLSFIGRSMPKTFE